MGSPSIFAATGVTGKKGADGFGDSAPKGADGDKESGNDEAAANGESEALGIFCPWLMLLLCTAEHP